MAPLLARVILAVGLTGLISTLWQHLQLDRYVQVPFTRSSSGDIEFDDLLNQAYISRRVVAVADLHGDLEHAHNVLRMAGLIDNKEVPDWIGGHNVLVSTGDIVDRGDDTIKLYEMFQRLRSQAKQTGGDVLNCLGNHEMMNALGDWRYVTPGDEETFGGQKARRDAMSTTGWIGKEWLANFSITHSIPLLEASHLPGSLSKNYEVPSASFVHGGIHPSWAALGVDHINQVGQSLLFKALRHTSNEGWLPPDVTQEEMQFYGEGGPLWNRHYATADEHAACEEAKQARSFLGVRHMIMGHTPHLNGFVVRCEAGILLIDTGISRAYGGEQSALVFDTQLKHLKNGNWQEEEVISALYKGRPARVIHRTTRSIKEDTA